MCRKRCKPILFGSWADEVVGISWERVVVFAKSHSLPAELNFDEVMAVQVLGRLKGQERADALGQRDRSPGRGCKSSSAGSVTGRVG
jgi:hypothetical protein